MNSSDRPKDRRALSTHAEAIRTDGDERRSLVLVEAFAAAQKVDPRELTHGFHSYAARFHPRLVRTLLSSRPPGLVCDPFCGSGTTLVEAIVAGCRGIGSDLNPLALELARVKALAPTHAHRQLPTELVAAATKIGEASWARVKARKRTKTDGTQWDDPSHYAPHVFRELVGLRELIDEQQAGAVLRRALLLCFSAILIKVSRRASETNDQIVERTIGKGLPSRLFADKARELAKGLDALFALTPAGAPGPTVHRADARKLKHIEERTIDTIVTSPPYLGTYDYAAHHERRLGWLGLKVAQLATHEIGARRHSDDRAAIATWQSELDDVVAEMARILKPDGAAFIVIGDSRAGNRAIAGDRPVRLAAEKVGLRVVAAAAELRDVGGRKTEEHLIELVPNVTRPVTRRL